MCTGFIIAKIVAVYTGPTGLAMIGQIQSVVGIFNGLVNAPAASGVIRYTAENSEAGYDACSPWWRAALQWILVILAILIPLGILISKPLSLWLFNNNDYYWIIIIACCGLPFAAANTLITSVLNGQQKYKRYVILGMIANIISTGFMITFVYFANIEGALIAAVINSAIAGGVMIVASLRQPWFKLKYWWGKTTSEQRKKIGGYVLMAMTSAFTVPISLILVRNILIAQVGWAQTGEWQAVWKISEVYLSVITLSLSTYYLPRLSSITSFCEIKQEINKTALIIMPIVIVMAFGVYLSRDIAISLLFTEEFSGASKLFAIQLIGDVIKILAWLYAFPMLSRGATKWFITTEMIFFILFPLLSYFMVNKFGLQGATISYAVTYLIYFLFIFMNFKRITLFNK